MRADEHLAFARSLCSYTEICKSSYRCRQCDSACRADEDWSQLGVVEVDSDLLLGTRSRIAWGCKLLRARCLLFVLKVVSLFSLLMHEVYAPLKTFITPCLVLKPPSYLDAFHPRLVIPSLRFPAGHLGFKSLIHLSMKTHRKTHVAE